MLVCIPQTKAMVLKTFEMLEARSAICCQVDPNALDKIGQMIQLREERTYL